MTGGERPVGFRRLAILQQSLLAALLCLAPLAAPLPAQAATHIPVPAIVPNGSWTTYHHDDGHTGFDPLAPTAVAASIGPTTGWKQTVLDAEVYAEPLIYNGLVYVATLNNTVYALNQTDGSIVWSRNLGAAETGGWLCGNVSPQGILGTPVIDPGTGRIYVAALFTSDIYHVEGLNLTTGLVERDTPLTLTGAFATFDRTIQQQRGALVVRNGFVYVPFGGRAGDCGNYSGWVVGVPTSGSGTPNVFQTPNTGNGIWTAGGIVVDDSTGNVFGTTGNGVNNGSGDGCSADISGNPVFQNDAVVRLSSTLVQSDFFMPDDWQADWCQNDQDLGSASPLLISPNVLFQAGKWGTGFLLDPTNLGGLDGQRYPAPKPAPYLEAPVCYGNNSDATFGSFAYAAPFIYLECEGQGLVGLHVDTSVPSLPTFSRCDATCAAPDLQMGGTTTFGPPIVAGGAVWAASNGGGLTAFNATTGAQMYQSAGFGINRFVTPAEAGGQVFVPSHNVIRSFSFGPTAPVAYTAVKPVRLLDTRSSGGPLGAGRSRNLTVAGVSPGAPAGATAAIINVTVTSTTAPSFLTVYPTGNARPLASNLNWAAGKTVANLVAVRLGAGGAVTLYNSSGSANVVVDLEGYFAAPSGTAGQEVALTPARITDTRSGSGQPNTGRKLGAGATLGVQVTGSGGIPSTGVSAAILNVTATDTTAPSFLTVWPAGTTRPTASNLNWVAGQTVPNRVIVPVGTGGKVDVYNPTGAVDVVVDVSGYFTDATATGRLFVPMSPVRIADTRGRATLGPGGKFTLQVSGTHGVPGTATAVVVNVTVTNTTGPSFLTVYPSTAARPTASDLNWTAGMTVPNLVVATLGSTGAITFYNSAGKTDAVVDLVGYFN
jgi:PQQ-like domain